MHVGLEFGLVVAWEVVKGLRLGGKCMPVAPGELVVAPLGM